MLEKTLKYVGLFTVIKFIYEKGYDKAIEDIKNQMDREEETKLETKFDKWKKRIKRKLVKEVFID